MPCPVNPDENWHFQSAYEEELYEEIAHETGISFREIFAMLKIKLDSPIPDAPLDVCLELHHRLEQLKTDSKTLDEAERGREMPVEHAFRIWLRAHESMVFHRNHEPNAERRKRLTAMLKKGEASMSAILNRKGAARADRGDAERSATKGAL
jgi:hypothetical protein